MNRNLSYFTISIILIFTLFSVTIESISVTIAQIDPSQEQIEPIPPSNNTNQSSSIVISQPAF